MPSLECITVSREPDSHLTTSVYKKPMHNDQYLAYDSNHPQSVKHSIVNCLYDWAKCLLTRLSVISRVRKDFIVSSCFKWLYFLLCAEKSTRPEDQPQEAWLYSMSRKYQSLFAADYNKAVA